MNKLKECKLLMAKESKKQIINQVIFWFISNCDDDNDDDDNDDDNDDDDNDDTYGLW
jgi:hypothetical protein